MLNVNIYNDIYVFREGMEQKTIWIGEMPAEKQVISAAFRESG